MDEGFDAHFLPSVKSHVLDDYLEKGWYRMAMLMFTTNELTVSGIHHKVYWLRYDVPEIKLNNKHLRLLKANSNFTDTCRPFCINPEVDELHRLYHSAIDFETPSSLEEILFDTQGTIFESYIVELRFHGRLIGAGIFDKGSDTIAGIKIFYDPSFKKYSPGKQIILLTYLHCLEKNIKWYYPGYYSPTYSKFDYKLFLDKSATQVFLPNEKKWIEYDEFQTWLDENTPRSLA